MRPWTLVLIGIALVALAWRAFLAPFPGPGGNPYLDLIAHHDPGLHRAIHVWHFLTPGVAVLLAGSIMLSVSRVWLQPRARSRNRGRLPAWPALAERRRALARGRRTAPPDRGRRERAALLARRPREGTLHRPARRRSRRHRQDHRLHVPVRPAAALLAGRRSRPPRGRARARSQRGLLPPGAAHPEGRRAGGRLPRDRARRLAPVEPARRSAARLLLDGLRRRVAHQPALRQVPRTVLATGVHEPRALDRRAAPASAGGLGHAQGRVPLHGRREAVREQDRGGEGGGPAAVPHAGRHRRQGPPRPQEGARRLGLGRGAGRRDRGVPVRCGTRSAAREAEGRVRHGAGRRRRGTRVRRAGGRRRAVVPEGLDGARRQAPHLDRRGHQRVPVALRPAGGRGRVLPAAAGEDDRLSTETQDEEDEDAPTSSPCRGSGAGCRRSAT